MEQLIRYIEENRSTYTRQAITDQLLARGFEPADIEAAWEIVVNRPQPGQPGPQYFAAPPRPKVSRMPAFWLTLFGFVLGAPVVTGLIVALTGGGTTAGFYALFFMLGLILVGGIAGAVWLHKRNLAVSRGLIWGLVVSTLLILIPPFVGLIIIAGVCSVAGGEVTKVGR